MLVLQPLTGLILKECPDRRASPRLGHIDSVEIDGRTVTSLDISSHGLSAVLPAPVRVGEIVCVRLAGSTGSIQDVVTSARVARSDAKLVGVVVGLEFID
jgi:hypothetical protein